MLSKYAWLISAEKINFVRTCCGRNKSDILHNKGPHARGNIKWRSFALRFCASTLNAHDNLCFPLRRAYLLLLSPTLHKSHGDFHPSFLHFILWQAQCVGKILIYIANWMWVFMNYYCWVKGLIILPWSWVNKRKEKKNKKKQKVHIDLIESNDFT